jgi:hypothetical protein
MSARFTQSSFFVNFGDCSPILVLVFDYDSDLVSENQLGQRMLGNISERLTHFGGVNSMQPNLHLLPAWGEDGQSVAVVHRDDAARKLVRFAA